MASDADDTDGVVSGTFSELLEQVETIERENATLVELLRNGRSLTSDFHAQLMIDNLRLTSEKEEITAKFEEAKMTEDTRKKRIAFLFEDCQRLSTANDVLVERSRQEDDKIRRLEDQLRQQEVGCQEAFSQLRHVEDACRSSEKALEESTSTYSKLREKLVAHHVERWGLEERVLALRKEELKEPSTAPGTDGTCLLPASHAEPQESPRCMRPDCIEVRRQLEICSMPRASITH